MNKSNEKEGNKTEFICGVVEGFYGRPWTKIQREELFGKLKRWGLGAYVYAPKDDFKHRAYWRETYTVEEAELLSSLVAFAKQNSIRFYYALSPGLDITYSSPKEMQALKRKLDQVAQFGCEAFALLFDDIESELSKVDKETFQTFANAQVAVANEIFTHLGTPHFLFCPTQYCSTRAIPNVRESEYLNTLGTKLNNDIDVLWTGEKVITKNITLESIEEITEVLRRPPVIWDNIFANDYDQKRVFLGPFTGRSPALIPQLRGVLINPNCEFHANTVGIHTLAAWSRCSLDSKINISMSADMKLETENEYEMSTGDLPIECCKSSNIYHPKIALENALAEWLPEFFVEKEAWGPITKPQPQVTIIPIIPIIPSINTCMSLTTTTSTSTTTKTTTVPEVNTTQLQALAEICTTVSSSPVIPISTPVMNSLVSPTKVIMNDDIPNPIISTIASNIELPEKIPISVVPVPIMENVKSLKIVHCELSTTKIEFEKPAELFQQSDEETQKLNKAEAESLTIDEQHMKGDQTKDDHNSSPLEAMECTSLTSQKSLREAHKSEDDVIMIESSSIQETCMQIENAELSPSSNEMKEVDAVINNSVSQFLSLGDESERMTVADLHLLCELFYLPFEHGNRGCKILNDFNWLKANAHVLLAPSVPDQKVQVDEWVCRAERFNELNDTIQTLMLKVAKCANKEICYDLYTYVWDIGSALVLMNAFLKWLRLRQFPANMFTFTQGTYTWFSKGWKEAFMSGDQEPWVFRGGLIADLQRLIPVDSGNDLFVYKLPEFPRTHYYMLRPYENSDESAVYDICQQQFLQNFLSDDMNEVSPQLSNLISDSVVGPFLTLQPDFCMVAQNSTADKTIVGYCAAALDANVFWRNISICWLPEMREKYALPACSDALNTLSTNSPELGDIMSNFVQDFQDEEEYQCPIEIFSTYPAAITMGMRNEIVSNDESLLRRLLTVILAALRSNGCFGAHVRLLANDNFLTEIILNYNKVSFVEIFRSERYVYLGRRF